MGKKSPPPKPPDLTPISDAQLRIAEEANELAREQLGLSKEQFAFFQENAKEELVLAREQADRLFEFQNKAFESDEEAKEFARQVGQTQIDAMHLQMGFAKEDRARYEKIFLPMQDKFIKEANAYDTPQRRTAEAARQMSDVQRQTDAARNNADQRLRSMGIDPSQVRSTSLLKQIQVGGAANQALVGNNARMQVEDRGRALRADALNIGMGLPAQAAAGFQGSNASGAGAINAGSAGQAAQLGAIQGGAGVAGTAMGFRSGALSNLAALTGSPMQWAQMGAGNMGMASNAYGSAAGTLTQNYQNQQSHWKAGQEQAQQNFNNIMSVASMAGGMMMAEGGAVSRERIAAGKTKVDLLKPGLTQPGQPGGSTWDRLRDRWAQNRAENDPYTRQGSGSGAGGKLDIMDRLGNAAMAGSQYQGSNVYSDMPDAAPSALRQIPMQAEGGRAVPVRQSRDKIPTFLTEGEYVIPRDVAQAKGFEFFDKLVQKYHREGS